jgi:hypothetical protein
VADTTDSGAMFPRCHKRSVEASFTGGDITSHGSGALLLQQAERKLGLVHEVARRIGDGRRQASVEHTLPRMLLQRVLAIALGHEDLNDHLTLRDVSRSREVRSEAQPRTVREGRATGPRASRLGCASHLSNADMGNPPGAGRALHRLIRHASQGAGAGLRRHR